MKNTKQQASRKAPPPRLSAEEELAELLADPTLQPSISFLGIRPSSVPYPTPEEVAGTVSIPPTEPDPVPSKFIPFRNLRRLGDLPAPESIPGTGTVPDIVSRPALLSVPDPVLRSGLLKSITPRYQKPRARRALTMEDGHSHIEQHVYTTLWNAAEAHTEDTRILTMGFGTMSHLIRLSLNNCRLNVRALVRKLAIEEHREELCPQGVGKTYLIYAPESILRRRQQAGLEWVIRTRGVVFVDPATEQPLEKEA
jgi:hypothetical protein